MQRVKLAFVGLAALMGVFALSGCQYDPNRAVTMGSYTLDEAQVEKSAEVIEADLRVVIEEAKRSGQQVDEGPVRGDARQAVVQFSAFNELARRYAQEKGYQVPAPDYAAAAADTGLPESDPYVQLVANAQVYRNLLLSKVPPAAPTEADLQEAHRRYENLGQLTGAQGGYSFADLKEALEGREDFRRGVGVRNELLAAAQRYGLVVNPRYAPLDFPLTSVQTDLGALTIVGLPLGDQGTGAVRDTSLI